MNIKNICKHSTLLLSAILFLAFAINSEASNYARGEKQPSKQPPTSTAYYGKRGRSRTKKSLGNDDKHSEGIIAGAMGQITEQDRNIPRHYQSCSEIPEYLRPTGSVEDYLSLMPNRPGLGYRPMAKPAQGNPPVKITPPAAVRDAPSTAPTTFKSPVTKKKTVLRFLRRYRKKRCPQQPIKRLKRP